ncbi:imidazole glycerol phosphate synthase subunit HisH [Dongshaea marina]|uniref:imidazole glycerol phosphate synthase subunit HisH n=1 Tax=Dongshaea marina TaxID=2047966 RepID=UPI000D3E425F|nr:imidazole glycerol phosphate synthase subunit HisH [Dongshaea marina]
MKKIDLIDFGTGNLFSIIGALRYLGAELNVVSRKGDFSGAGLIVLPGVGAYPAAMKTLKSNDIQRELQYKVSCGIPILGICLGMQLLFEKSYEFEACKGLGLLSGEVTPLPSLSIDGLSLRIPHVGWSQVTFEGNGSSPLVGGLMQEDYYFVHSLSAITQDSLGFVEFGGHKITAYAEKKNIFGCQFHPEKSGDAGLHMLESFINL